MVDIKDEFDWNLDSGGSRAFALTDHQVAHIYIQEKSRIFAKVKAAIESLDGVAMVLEGDAKQADLDHPRAGDLYLPAKRMPGSHIISGKRMKKPRICPLYRYTQKAWIRSD